MQKIFNPDELSEFINIKFNVIPLDKPKIIWINQRWLIQIGVDPFDSEALTSFSNLIINNFAVTSTNSTHQKLARDNFRSYLYADRYGGTGGLVHGGSGRCGAIGDYIAKGIGKTPLVSETADIYHKNGYAWISEAVKEALCSEVTNRELPHGSIPVVAIIDTGLTLPSPDQLEKRRGSIIIRPTIVRPAHFERSIYFGKGGKGSAQFVDAMRVKTAVDYFVSNSEKYPSLQTMFHRFARQVGAARALRLWQGRFLSSNISIDGALLDFGSFRTTPNWSRAIGLAGEAFGAEINQLKSAFLSVASYFAKYRPDAVENLDPANVLEELSSIEQQSFLNVCLSSLGVDRNKKELIEEVACLLKSYFKSQQEQKVEATKARHNQWIYELYSPHSEIKKNPIACKLVALLKETDNLPECSHQKSKAEQFFHPRNSLNYKVIERKTRIVEKKLMQQNFCNITFDRYLNKKITQATMWTSVVKSDLVPIAGTCTTYSCAIYCRRLGSSSNVFWIQAAFNSGVLYFFKHKIKLLDLQYEFTEKENAMEFEMPSNSYENGVFHIAGLQIEMELIAL